MGLIDFFKQRNDVDAFKDIASNNENIKNTIAQAVGLVSLVAIGLELYNTYQNNKRSPEEKAFASLLKFVFQTTDDLLKDIKYKEGIKAAPNFEYNFKIMQENLFKPFEEKDQVWNSYLPDHPSIKKFKSNIISYLRNKNYDSSIIAAFEGKFSLQLENKAKDD